MGPFTVYFDGEYEYDEFGCIGEAGNALDRLKSMYDWTDEHSRMRTPQAHPYGFDGHFKWRDFDKNKTPKGLDMVYSDRMNQWDSEKYKEAFAGSGWIQGLDKKTSKEVIEKYYDGKYECVGYAVCCNVSNGYPIGMFYLMPKEAK